MESKRSVYVLEPTIKDIVGTGEAGYLRLSSGEQISIEEVGRAVDGLITVVPYDGTEKREEPAREIHMPPAFWFFGVM